MKRLQIASAATSIALFATACENMTPGENAAVFGTAAGLATGIPLGVAGVDPSIAIPVTAGAAVLAAAGSYIIAKEQASIRQRQVAEQRARLYLARQEKLQAEEKAHKTAAAHKASKSRYLAVQTEKSSKSQGKAAVMVFDTQTNQVVGNNVYDVSTAPQVGQTAKFDTYSTQYVGTGN